MAEAEALVTHVVTVVHLQLVAQVDLMLQKLLIRHQDVHILYVQAVHGRVVNHILVQQVWVVNHMSKDIIYQTFVQ